VARNAEAGICLACGAPVELEGVDDPIGKLLAGGDPNPDALARPAGRGSRASGGGGHGGVRSTGRPSGRTATGSGGSATGRRRPAASSREG
jgi:hypothetical protein